MEEKKFKITCTHARLKSAKKSIYSHMHQAKKIGEGKRERERKNTQSGEQTAVEREREREK